MDFKVTVLVELWQFDCLSERAYGWARAHLKPLRWDGKTFYMLAKDGLALRDALEDERFFISEPNNK